MTDGRVAMLILSVSLAVALGITGWMQIDRGYAINAAIDFALFGFFVRGALAAVIRG